MLSGAACYIEVGGVEQMFGGVVKPDRARWETKEVFPETCSIFSRLSLKFYCSRVFVALAAGKRKDPDDHRPKII